MTRPAADNIRVEWTGTGSSSPITLGSAVTGFQAFPAALDGAVVSYAIEHPDGTERESGLGTYTHSGTTLSRDLVTFSTAGGSTPETFSAGTKTVRLTWLALDGVENRSTSDPTTTDDIDSGYVAGRSRWLNTSSGVLFFCTDDTTSAAVWKPVTEFRATAARMIYGVHNDDLTPFTGRFLTETELRDVIGIFAAGNRGLVPDPETATGQVLLDTGWEDPTGLGDPTRSVVQISGTTHTLSAAQIEDQRVLLFVDNSDQDCLITMPDASGLGRWRIRTAAAYTSTVTVQRETSGTIDGGTTVTMIGGGREGTIEVIATPGGVAQAVAEGEWAVATVQDNDHDANGFAIYGNVVASVTVTGARGVATADSGKTLIYTGSGNTWTFNAANMDTTNGNPHGVIRNAGSGAITCTTDGTEKFTGTEPIPVDASATWEYDGTRLWLDVNA